MKLLQRKKGLGNIVQMLYPAALALLLVAVVVGVGVIVLDKFGSTAGLSGAASTAINNSRTAIADISNSWMTLIVTVVVLGLVILIVLYSFGSVRTGSGRN